MTLNGAQRCSILRDVLFTGEDVEVNVARRLVGKSIVKLVMKSRRLPAKLAKFMVSSTKNFNLARYSLFFHLVCLLVQGRK